MIFCPSSQTSPGIVTMASEASGFFVSPLSHLHVSVGGLGEALSDESDVDRVAGQRSARSCHASNGSLEDVIAGSQLRNDENKASRTAIPICLFSRSKMEPVFSGVGKIKRRPWVRWPSSPRTALPASRSDQSDVVHVGCLPVVSGCVGVGDGKS
jgi:hypothetical protein